MSEARLCAKPQSLPLHQEAFFSMHHMIFFTLKIIHLILFSVVSAQHYHKTKSQWIFIFALQNWRFSPFGHKSQWIIFAVKTSWAIWTFFLFDTSLWEIRSNNLFIWVWLFFCCLHRNFRQTGNHGPQNWMSCFTYAINPPQF